MRGMAGLTIVWLIELVNMPISSPW